MVRQITHIFLFFLLLTISNQSQETVKDLTIGNKWVYQQTGWAHGGINLNAKITFKVIGDTLIDNTEYAILLENYIGENGHSHIYRFYETADSLRLNYIYPCQPRIGWVDIIFYDFSMNIGDTIFYTGYNEYNTVIRKSDSSYWSIDLFNIDIETIQCRFGNINNIHIAQYFGVMNLHSEGLDNSYNMILTGAIIDGFIYGTVDIEAGDIIIPFLLAQNYPNPFNPTTTIKYQIPENSFVTLQVYDVLGNEITTLVNEEKPAGEYEVEFSSANLPSGIYFYQIKAGNFIETKKMVLLK